MRYADAVILTLGALLWGAFAVGQLTMPGHKFDPIWFTGDLVLCGLHAFAAVALFRCERSAPKA